MPVTWNRLLVEEFNVNVIVVIEKNDGVNDYKHNEARLEIKKKSTISLAKAGAILIG